jgi:hypothetical protein
VKRFGNTEENIEKIRKRLKKIMKRYRNYGTKVIWKIQKKTVKI